MPLAVDSFAPRFSLRDQHGRTHELDEHRGVRAVVLVFFPQAFTPTCTDELAELQRHGAEFAAADAAVLAISVDSVATLRAFADRDAIGIPLLSDFWPHGAVAEQYGVLLPDRGWAARTSFLVDNSGVVRAVIGDGGDEPRDIAAYRAALRML